MGNFHPDPGTNGPFAISNLRPEAKHGQIPRSGNYSRLRFDIQEFKVRGKYVPTRSWSLGQHENSLMSIVIGDGNARVYLIAKGEPKSKRLEGAR